MKRVIVPIILCVILLLVAIYIEPITNTIANVLENEPKIVIEPTNEYYRNYDFEFVQQTEDFVPYSYQGLLNIIYTMLNNGWQKFTFYCPDEYAECLNDVERIYY